MTRGPRNRLLRRKKISQTLQAPLAFQTIRLKTEHFEKVSKCDWFLVLTLNERCISINHDFWKNALPTDKVKLDVTEYNKQQKHLTATLKHGAEGLMIWAWYTTAF